MSILFLFYPPIKIGGYSSLISSRYCPQVGDSVVYIPRAHYDTLQAFPTGESTAPWKSWPTTQPWPVVRCKVTHVRYRFPYEMYYASGRRTTDGLKDVAAILTLEITGVPHHFDNRIFPWPAPVFTAPIASRTRSHDSTFEVTMFDSGQTDFVIPELLYICRIKGLEKAIEQNGGIVSDISITINFPPGEITSCLAMICVMLYLTHYFATRLRRTRVWFRGPNLHITSRQFGRLR